MSKTGDRSSSRSRDISSLVLIGLACLLTLVALPAGYARVALLDADQFADRATGALEQPPVRDRVATEITDRAIIEADNDLIAFRPLIQATVAGVVSSGPFRSLFRTAVSDFHQTVVEGKRDTATVFLADVGVLISGALESFNPERSRLVPAEFDADLGRGVVTRDAAEVITLADDLSRAAIPLALLAVALFTLAIVTAHNRRRAAIRAALGAAVAGGLLFLAVGVVGDDLAGGFATAADRDVAAAIWNAFFADLRSWALLLMGVGLVIAAACASLIRPVELRDRLAIIWRVISTRPRSTWVRALRAVILVGLGLLVMFKREWFLDLAVISFGGLIAFLGLEELLRLVAPADARPQAGRSGTPPGRRFGRAGRLVAVTAVGAVLISVAGTTFVVSGAVEPVERGGTGRCNGGSELCDRTVDEVAFPMTHNSMAAQTIPGWMFPQQEREIGVQLADGVRGLMIDAYYGREVGGRVRTELDAGELQHNLDQLLGGAGAASAQRIRDRLVGGSEPPGPKRVWLCHAVCEIGAIPMKESLVQIRDFVVANPEEVVTIVIQDEEVTPADIAAEFQKSGLRRYVYTGPVGPPWPTLAEMIETGGRVLVFGENEAGDPGVPWYHDAFESMQETPFHFNRPDQMSCRANRGSGEGSLFLLNHWIDTTPAPQPSNARKVNAREFLLDRARRCQKARGMLPNFVAVDFYRIGDLFGVVDELNSTAPASTTGG